jgi:hypothetical protein
MQMATRQNALPLTSKHGREATASACSPRGYKWLSWQCHFENAHLPHKGEYLSCIVACLAECIAKEPPIVTVVVKYSYPVLYGKLFKGIFCSHWGMKRRRLKWSTKW